MNPKAEGSIWERDYPIFKATVGGHTRVQLHRCSMASSKRVYTEPTARYFHVSFTAKGKVCLWVRDTEDSVSDSKDDRTNFIRCIELFDPYLEAWSQLDTAGTPHPGLEDAVCASYGENVYMYGGLNTEADKYEGALSCLNMKTLIWSQLCLGGTARGPMGKATCGMVHFHHDKLAVIGGYGIPSGPTQPGLTFIEDTDETDGSGWTNEIHVFYLSQGSNQVC